MVGADARQLGLVAGFFRLEWIWAAAAVIVLVLALIITFVMVAWQRERRSALLFLPYGAWVLFASALNLSIATLN